MFCISQETSCENVSPKWWCVEQDTKLNSATQAIGLPHHSKQLVTTGFDTALNTWHGHFRDELPSQSLDWCETPILKDPACQLVSDEGRHQLRSAISRTCVVRRTYSNYGDRCFAAAGPKLWNSLSADLWQADISFQRFKRLLKTFLFGCRDHGALWLTVKAVPHKFSYLLT